MTTPPGTLVFAIDPGIPGARTLGLQGIPIGNRPEIEIELDALSFGHDSGRGVFFSVDEFSNGLPASGVADQAMGFEASADIFRALDGPDHNLLAIDGTGGERPNTPLGLGLIEPNPPDSVQFDTGDNLDALNVNTHPMDLAGPIYFSLDAGFPDPAEPLDPPLGPNIGSAQQNGFSGADVLVSLPDQPTRIFIEAQQLGLNPLGDDLDALALLDADGNVEFDPQIDQVLFSVRRGSQVIGQIDAEFGIPISAADILSIPFDPSLPPSIFLPAEALGLNVNRDIGLVAPVAYPLPDDLNALSLGLQDGDMNCNFAWDTADVTAFALALESATEYENEFFATCFGPAALHGDLNLDGRFGFQDIEGFVRVISNSGVLEAGQVAAFLQGVPEPSGLGLGSWCLVLLCGCRARGRNLARCV